MGGGGFGAESPESGARLHAERENWREEERRRAVRRRAMPAKVVCMADKGLQTVGDDLQAGVAEPVADRG